ncbi:MAG: TlpA disulfide reductase family protein [Anaerolineales bacterium]|nr:TlpA disulfide reductase family protein [Anaerolineales bacterium]
MSIVIGVGLVLIGLALFSLLRGADKTPAADSTDRSVVPMAVNYPVPSLTLDNISGKTESLQDFSGDVFLVNNWATWCPPCKAEMPTLEKYYETHSAEGFTIIAIEAGEGKNEVAEFAKSFGLKFHVWLDPDGAAFSAFKNANLPNSYVIDRTGTVRYAWTGEISFDMLEKFVTPLIAESN